jgi:cysteinyl-tRNA synthetase
LVERLKKDFLKDMDDDFNTPKVLASLFVFINKINRILSDNISKNDFNKIKNIIFDMNKVFNILEKQEKIPKEVIRLADEREKARKNKDFNRADQLRKEINNKGYFIDDTSSGYVIKK